MDTHCHLLDPAFAADREAVVARARAAGVRAVILMGEDYADNVANLEAARRDAFFRAAAGHYPSLADLAAATRTETLVRAHREELTALGEVGLDHRVTDDPALRRVQEEILLRFAALGAELDLPLSVHSRSAGRRTIEVLRAGGAAKVVLHAFDGRYGSARAGLEAGYYFSVPPSVVRSRQKQKLVRRLPLERLLLESDAPVLGPDPKTRNEPAHVLTAARAVAELKGVALEEVVAVTGGNARKLFGVG